MHMALRARARALPFELTFLWRGHQGFLTTNKPTARTKPRAKSLAQAKATIYGRAYQRAPTYTSPKTSNAKAEKCISKVRWQRAAAPVCLIMHVKAYAYVRELGACCS